MAKANPQLERDVTNEMMGIVNGISRMRETDPNKILQATLALYDSAANRLVAKYPEAKAEFRAFFDSEKKKLEDALRS